MFNYNLHIKRYDKDNDGVFVGGTMKILLKEVMEAKNITYRYLEKKTGIPKSTLYEISSEHVSPTIGTLERIAKGLEIKISDLFLSDFK